MRSCVARGEYDRRLGVSRHGGEAGGHAHQLTPGHMHSKAMNEDPDVDVARTVYGAWAKLSRVSKQIVGNTIALIGPVASRL